MGAKHQAAYRKRHPGRVKTTQALCFAKNMRQDPEYAVKQHRRTRYQLTPEQFDALLALQGGVCAICRKPFVKRPHIDHDHACCPAGPRGNTKKTYGACTRGILCWHCNSGLGQFQDDVAILRSAVAYLEIHSGWLDTGGAK